jgi:Calx-beta domain
MEARARRLVRRSIGVAVAAAMLAALVPATAGAAGARRIAVSDASVIETDAGTRALSFRVAYSGKGVTGVTVAYATSAVTATSGSDYTDVAGTAALPAGGCKCRTIVVDVAGDLDVELAETLRIDLSDPVKAAIKDGVGIGTIVDNDTPSISVADVSLAEGDAGSSTATFTIAMSSVSPHVVEVGYATADVTATAGVDYTAGAGTLVFAPGETSKTVDVAVAGDTDHELDEQATFTLSTPVNAVIADDVAKLTIVDEDRIATLLTIRVTRGKTRAIARGILESVEATSQVRVTLQRYRNGRYRPVASQLVLVTKLADRDVDTLPDALYKAGFRSLRAGRYRMSAAFAGSIDLMPSATSVRFRI